MISIAWNFATTIVPCPENVRRCRPCQRMGSIWFAEPRFDEPDGIVMSARNPRIQHILRQCAGTTKLLAAAPGTGFVPARRGVKDSNFPVIDEKAALPMDLTKILHSLGENLLTPIPMCFALGYSAK